MNFKWKSVIMLINHQYTNGCTAIMRKFVLEKRAPCTWINYKFCERPNPDIFLRFIIFHIETVKHCDCYTLCATLHITQNAAPYSYGHCKRNYMIRNKSAFYAIALCNQKLLYFIKFHWKRNLIRFILGEEIQPHQNRRNDNGQM